MIRLTYQPKMQAMSFRTSPFLLTAWTANEGAEPI